MPNQPTLTPPTFHKGQVGLKASDLQRIVDLLVKRISGGRGIKVSSFGGRIIIEKKEGSDTVVNV